MREICWGASESRREMRRLAGGSARRSRNPGQKLCLVVDDTNKASMRSVTGGPRIGSDWLIDTGLKPGDRIVVEGLQRLTEGGSVQPTAALANASPAPASE